MEKTVKEAALLMDRLKPGWYKLVDTKSLDMSDPDNCILSQVFGSYYEAFDEEGIDKTAYGYAFRWFTDQWLSEIEQRLKPGVKVVDKRRGVKVRYDSLAQGTVFMDDGCLLMKTNYVESEDVTSICLNDGEAYTYGDDDLVNPVSVELHLVD